MSRRLGKVGEETQWERGIINWCKGWEKNNVAGKIMRVSSCWSEARLCLIHFDYSQTSQPIRVNFPSLQISRSVTGFQGNHKYFPWLATNVLISWWMKRWMLKSELEVVRPCCMMMIVNWCLLRSWRNQEHESQKAMKVHSHNLAVLMDHSSEIAINVCLLNKLFFLKKHRLPQCNLQFHLEFPFV